MAKAKAKSKGKKAAGKKPKPITLPNGYKVIGRAPNWDFNKNPVIEGERSDAREVVFDEGTKKERSVRTMIVSDEELGAVTVWESGGLRDLFDQTVEGQTVRIEYLGEATSKKKGQNAMRLFSCAVKD
jgi:hypothetical protein